jgi:hypothetical protein
MRWANEVSLIFIPAGASRADGAFVFAFSGSEVCG